MPGTLTQPAGFAPPPPRHGSGEKAATAYVHAITTTAILQCGAECTIHKSASHLREVKQEGHAAMWPLAVWLACLVGRSLLAFIYTTM